MEQAAFFALITVFLITVSKVPVIIFEIRKSEIGKFPK